MNRISILATVGDYYHDEELCRLAIDEAVKHLKSEVHVEVEYVAENHLVERLQNQPDLVILFKINKLNPKDETSTEVWMGNEAAAAIKHYVEEGGAWMAWHAGTAQYEAKDYLDLLKGSFDYHPKVSTVKYSAEKDNGVIDSDFSYEILDEHYFVNYDAEGTNVFLRSESKDGESIAGWAHHYGKGRVLCLTPAHLREGLLNPMTTQLLVDSIKWCIAK